MINSIKLISHDENDAEVNLKIHKGSNPYTVENIIATSARVYEDKAYDLEIVADELIMDGTLEVYVNGAAVDILLSSNHVTFRLPGTGHPGSGGAVSSGDWESGIFYGQMGFAQISMAVLDSSGRKEWYYSDFVSILIKASKRNRDVDLMLDFIYENQEDLLTEGTLKPGSSDNLDNSHDDFASLINLLEDIANVYESSYGYFKANSRTKLEQVEVVDRVERLQYVDARTVQYITQHPELLRKSMNGIRIGEDYYLPNRTLMVQNRMTQNIYENRVVVGFLQKLFRETGELKKEISNLLKAFIVEEQYQQQGYIVSSQLFYQKAVDTLKEYNSHIQELNDRYERLFWYYRTTMNVELEEMVSMPEATPIFLSVPQYNRIYMCILKWFGKKGYDFRKEKSMMNFVSMPFVFEYYVLARLVYWFRRWGYAMSSAEFVEYPGPDGWMYKNRECRNTFVFEKRDVKITLYYNPVIYDEDRRSVNGIALYRNNSLSPAKDGEEDHTGHYYTPDYLFKVEKNGKEKYVICDAKYSRFEKVRSVEVPQLSYKYLFSVSPLDARASVDGMVLFYGIPDSWDPVLQRYVSHQNAESFYDRELTPRIRPFVELTPVSELFYGEVKDAVFENFLNRLLQD